jgi:hypothetical protein
MWKTIEKNGISYLDMNSMSKSDLKFINKLPEGHGVYCERDLYIKMQILNPNNPPRASVCMIRHSDYMKLRDIEQNQNRLFEENKQFKN